MRKGFVAILFLAASLANAQEPRGNPPGKPEVIQIGEFAHGGHTVLEIGRRALVSGGNLMEALSLPPHGTARAFREVPHSPKVFRVAGRALMVLAALSTVDEIYVYSTDKRHWRDKVMDEIDKLAGALRALGRPIQLGENGIELTPDQAVETYRRLADELARENPETLARLWDVGMNFIPILPIFLDAETPIRDNALAYGYARLHAEVEALRAKIDLINADQARRNYIATTRAVLSQATCVVYYVCEHDASGPEHRPAASADDKIPYYVEAEPAADPNRPRLPRVRRLEVAADLLEGGVDPVLVYRRMIDHVSGDYFQADACSGIAGLFDPRRVLSDASAVQTNSSLLNRALSVARDCGDAQPMAQASRRVLDGLDQRHAAYAFPEGPIAARPVNSVFVLGSQLKTGDYEWRYLPDARDRQRLRSFARALEEISNVSRSSPSQDYPPYPYSIGPRR